MRTGIKIAVLAAMAALETAAFAQLKSRARPPVNCSPFACPPRPIAGKLPSDEALALGRRIASAVDSRTVAKRTGELVAIAQAKEPPRASEPRYPNGPIRAIPPVDLANYPMWAFVVQQRVIDHAALYYAGKYSLDELKQMAAFFEGSAGKKLVEERQPQSAELKLELATDTLEDDLWNVVCGWPVPQEVEDAPHHEFERLHPPLEDFPLPPRPEWCAAEAQRRTAQTEQR